MYWFSKVICFLLLKIVFERCLYAKLNKLTMIKGRCLAPSHQAVFAAGLSHWTDHVQLHAQLVDHYKDQPAQAFTQTSKTHFSLHGLDLCKYIHPYLIWCYKGETLMHKMQRVLKSCLPGAKHFHVANRVAVKYMYLSHINHTDK